LADLRSRSPTITITSTSGTNFVRVERGVGEIVCERCEIAETAWARTKGLLGRRELPAGEGLFIRPCGSIHMFFMRFPIDAVFVDREMKVVGVAPVLRPWRVAWRRRAHSVFELAAGEAERRGVRTGDVLVLHEQELDESAEG
jgi:uncharacterized membrane protein (UPF0127 family)